MNPAKATKGKTEFNAAVELARALTTIERLDQENERLEAEVERLAVLDWLKSKTMGEHPLLKRIAELEAENERLREALRLSQQHIEARHHSRDEILRLAKAIDAARGEGE